ncbi:MAG: hypothetical protein PUB13_03205, partial [Lachnospiraceae bacterium]|nr:hypothetical protein [Lachnospiraceae bacterium]
MKEFLKRDIFSKIVKCMMILVSGVVAGYLALALVYALPTDGMERHVQESYDMIKEEGISPRLIKGYESTRLDNYSDGLILNSAIYDGDESVWEKAAAIYQHTYEGENYYFSLLKHLDSEPGEITGSYERDWHGYLVYVKLLLLFMNYADIRMLNMVIQIALVVYLIYLMKKKELGKYIPAVGMMLIFLTWSILFYSIEYSAMFYVLMLASVLVICKNRNIISKNRV